MLLLSPPGDLEERIPNEDCRNDDDDDDPPRAIAAIFDIFRICSWYAG